MEEKRVEMLLSKNPQKVKVQYKFKGKDEVQQGEITWKEFENLKKMELVEFCEIID